MQRKKNWNYGVVLKCLGNNYKLVMVFFFTYCCANSANIFQVS